MGSLVKEQKVQSCFSGVYCWVSLLLQFKARKLLEVEVLFLQRFNHGASIPSIWEVLDLVLLEALMVLKAVTLEVAWEVLSLAQVQCLGFHQAMVCDHMTSATTSCTMTWPWEWV